MPESRKPDQPDEIDLALAQLGPHCDAVPQPLHSDDITAELPVGLVKDDSVPTVVAPNDELTVPVHTDIAMVNQLVNGLPSSAAAIESGEFGILGEVPTGVRAHLHAILASKHPDLSPEKLKQDYEALLRLMEECGLINGESEPAPYFSDVIRSFSTEAMIYASEFISPTILLVPDIKSSRLVRAIQDIFTKIRSRSCINRIMVHPLLNDAVNTGPEKITKWTPTIVEGSSIIPSDKLFTFSEKEPPAQILEKRVQGRNSIDAGMSLQKYLMLVMVNVSNMGGFDSESATIIDNEPSAKEHQVIQAFQTNKSQWIGLARAERLAQGVTSGFQIPATSCFRSSVDGELEK